MNTISLSVFSKTVVADNASCEPRGEFSAPIQRNQPLIASLILTIGALLLGGCAGGITGVKLDPSKTVCDPTGAVCGASDSDFIYFLVSGQGECGTIGVKYGDGAQENANGHFSRLKPYDIPFQHEYTAQYPQGSPRAWPGPRTVHAYSVSNCVGEAKMQVNVLLKRTNAAGQVTFLPAFRIGMVPTAMVCNVPDSDSMKPIRNGSTVSITERPGGPTMNFGCAGDPICQNNNMAGNSGATHLGFPFPDMRRHSLVLRIVDANGGAKTWQGGAITRFVADRTGPLEFCVNDTVMSDNSGAWALDVSVDETTVP